MVKKETVSIIYQPPRILLGMKKIRFGKGRYNGFGGRIENSESLEESAIRETFEEAGITMVDPERMGELLFQFKSGEPDHLVNFFKATKFQGIPIESDEMRPEWFMEDRIPYNKMWPDDKYWLPLLLRGQKFKGNFLFNLEFKIDRYELNEIDVLK